MQEHVSFPSFTPVNSYFLEMDGDNDCYKGPTGKEYERDQIIQSQLEKGSFMDIFINQTVFDVPDYLKEYE